MHYNVRVKLTLWYVAILAVVLVIFSIGVYSLLGNSLRQRLDGSLRSVNEVAALSLNHEIEEHGGKRAGEANVRFVLNTMHQTSFPRPNISIWEGNRLVAEKPGIAGIPGVSPVHEHSASREPTMFRTVQNSKGSYRVAVSVVAVPFVHSSYTVVVNESVQPIDAELGTLRKTLIVSVPIWLLLAAVGGYFLVRKTLAPVLGMAVTAEKISSHNLDQRLLVTNQNDELGQLADTFNRLFARLQKSFRQQRQFMADASHELRTPMSVALTATQVTLQSRRHSIDELYNTLEVVQSQLLRLRRVVEDMFMLAQADAGSYQPTMTSFYLDEVVLESIRAARVLAKLRDTRVLDRQILAGVAFEGDEGLLRQLVMIFLDNAVKYTPRGSTVAVSLIAENDGYRITIEDNGCGIAVSDQPYIFDRFYRADKSRSRREAGTGSGAGLGLAIAQWIAGLHHGKVSLDKSDHDGTSFGVWLPKSLVSAAQTKHVPVAVQLETSKH